MKYLKTIYLLLCCTLALAACSDDDENSASGALSITTPDRPDSTDDVLRKSLCHPLQRRAQILGGNFFHDSRRDTER